MPPLARPSISVPLTANLIRQPRIYQKLHRYQSQCHILRAQLGFNQVESDRPHACQGCCHYHGKAYGQARQTRTRLICAFHPYGWLEDHLCPDWHE